MATSTASNGSIKKAPPAEKIEKELTERQKLFCYYYTSDSTCFCNASASYAKAYGMPKNDVARSNGYRLLINAHIKRFINAILDAQFKDVEVDRALATLIHQNKDLYAKMSAISEYNKLRARITGKIEITIPKPIYGGKSKK